MSIWEFNIWVNIYILNVCNIYSTCINSMWNDFSFEGTSALARQNQIKAPSVRLRDVRVWRVTYEVEEGVMATRIRCEQQSFVIASSVCYGLWLTMLLWYFFFFRKTCLCFFHVVFFKVAWRWKVRTAARWRVAVRLCICVPDLLLYNMNVDLLCKSTTALTRGGAQCSEIIRGLTNVDDPAAPDGLCCVILSSAQTSVTKQTEVWFTLVIYYCNMIMNIVILINSEVLHCCYYC